MRSFSPSRRTLLGALPAASMLAGARLQEKGLVSLASPESAALQGGNSGGEFLRAEAFGAVGDGRTDDTAAIAALLAAMQQQGRPGLLGGHGRITNYLVRAGQLEWRSATAGQNEAGPFLYTAGRVVLKVSPGSPDRPILYIHNDPVTGGRFIVGGYIGPLEFSDTTGDRGTNRHAVQLYGVTSMRFGPLFSESLQGDLLHIERKGTLLTGDAWHVAGCTFEGLTTWNTAGWTLNNNSLSQFFNGNELGLIWNIDGGKGGWRGPGAANYCRMLSVQGNAGWAVDWTPANASDSVQGSIIEYSELDGPEYGIRVNGVQSFRIGVRFIHRRQELPRQAGQVPAWPKVALQVGGPEGLATRQGTISAFHFFRAGITEATRGSVGSLVDLQNDSTTQEIEICNSLSFTERLSEISTGVRLDPAKFVVRHNPHSRNLNIFFDGRSVIRNSVSNALIARIAQGRLPAAYGHGSRLDFGSVFLDEGGNYSRQDREYRVRSTGKYHIAAQIMVNAPAGERVRLGILVDGVVDREIYGYASGGEQSFRVEAQNYFLNLGQRISIAGAADSQPSFAAGTAGILANNRLEITET